MKRIYYSGLAIVFMCAHVFAGNVAHAQQNAFKQTQDKPNSELQLNLSDEVIDAVNRGVSLTFVSEYAQRQSWFFLSWQSVAKEHRFVVIHHALSNRYLVRRDAIERPAIFRSLGGAMDFITTRSVAMLDSYSDSKHPYNLRISLSKYKLPAPMRLIAFTSRDWDLDTGWISWQLDQ